MQVPIDTSPLAWQVEVVLPASSHSCKTRLLVLLRQQKTTLHRIKVRNQVHNSFKQVPAAHNYLDLSLIYKQWKVQSSCKKLHRMISSFWTRWRSDNHRNNSKPWLRISHTRSRSLAQIETWGPSIKVAMSISNSSNHLTSYPQGSTLPRGMEMARLSAIKFSKSHWPLSKATLLLIITWAIEADRRRAVWYHKHTRYCSLSSSNLQMSLQHWQLMLKEGAHRSRRTLKQPQCSKWHQLGENRVPPYQCKHFLSNGRRCILQAISSSPRLKLYRILCSWITSLTRLLSTIKL